MSVTYTDSAIRDSVKDILNRRKYSDVIRGLIPNSTFTLNIMEDGLYELFLHRSDDFKQIIKDVVISMKEEQYNDYDNVKYAFRDMGINLVTEDVIKIHELNARAHERTIVTFDCEIIAVERVKSYIKHAECVCPLCYNVQEVKCTYEREIVLPTCSNVSCKKQKMILSKQHLVTDNLQFVYLQELLSNVKNNTPTMIRGILLGNLAGSIYVGGRKRITGLYKTLFSSGKDNIYEVIVEVLTATDLEEKKSNVLTQEEIEVFKNESKNEGYIDKLVNSFAPLIIGYHDIKFSILLYLVSGHSTTKRSDINVLLVGDPSLAKSELLKECSKVSHKSMCTSGRGASAAGLTIGLVKMDNGNYVAQAGVMPICDGGHACIDEFDKMRPEDRSAMHECMEQQTTSIAKAGFRMTLPARTSVLAAANPKYGRYDISESLIDNIDIPVPLISRFDMIWLIRDIVNKEDDEIKARHILDTFTGNKQFENVFLTREKLSSLLLYVRGLEPTITKEAQDELLRIYTSMRSLSSADSLPIGVRQLESLARMVTAHAKLLFKEVADVSDVMAIENLIKKMYESLNMSLSKGHNQTTLMIGKNDSKEQTANKIWHECEDENRTVKQTEFIAKLIESGKFSELSANTFFGKWETQCHIKLKGDGRWQKT